MHDGNTKVIPDILKKIYQYNTIMRNVCVCVCVCVCVGTSNTYTYVITEMEGSTQLVDKAIKYTT